MINATSGISCAQNVRFLSGISAISGIKGALPGSYQAFYPFSSDFIDQVSGDYVAVFDNAPSFGGGGVNTVSDTDLKVSTYESGGKGAFLDDGNGGVPVVLGDRSDVGFNGGINDSNGAFTWSSDGGGGGPGVGKYISAMDTRFLNGVLSSKDGNSIALISTVSNVNSGFLTLIKGSYDDLRAPNQVVLDFSFSLYAPSDEGDVRTLRAGKGDDITGIPTAVQWDTSGDFRFGYIGIGKTVADITSQVLLQTGNMGISTGIGITFAEIGASISALSVVSDTIVGECFIKYVGGMLSIIIDGVESTPVASAAPAIGAFAQIGANTSNTLAAPGTYGGLLFEVL